MFESIMANASPNMMDVPEESLHLRRAIYKLKLENSRMKHKLKALSTTVRQLIEATGKQTVLKTGPIEADKDYEDLGRDYILVGGPSDPFSIRFEVVIKDKEGIQHKSAERYYWYKKAEHFKDVEAMKKIKDSTSSWDAENAVKAIKNVNDRDWDPVKLGHWEEAQRLKLEQVRWIANLLVASGTTYIAVASRDKQIGTGWNKKREESSKPYMWDGENLGGKFLMAYRQQLQQTHVWLGPNEEKEARQKFDDLRLSWRRRTEQERGRPIGVLSRHTGNYGAPSFVNRPQLGTFPQKVRYVREEHPTMTYGSYGGYNQSTGNAHAVYNYGAPVQGYM